MMLLRRRMKLRPSTKSFRFADATYKSLGRLDLPLATPNGVTNIDVTLDVVAADVPTLLGLDVLDHHCLTADTVCNELVKKTIIRRDGDGVRLIEDWSVPLMRADGHVYADIAKPDVIYFTRKELQKLHRHFAHPSAEKLYKLLRKARPEDTNQETLKTLEDLVKRCGPCQRIQSAPNRFRVLLGAEELRFNEEIYMDIMYIENNPVLHFVDAATNFSAARYPADVSTKTVWATFADCWALLYTGMPNRIRVDRGSCFGDQFFAIAKSVNVEVGRSGVEAHSSLGIGERYHQPLVTPSAS